MKSLLSVLVTLALACAACGGGGDAQEVLAATSANMGKVKSGDLNMELLFAATDGERAGFSLQGPFAHHPGALPEEIGGDDTDRISADLNVAATVNTLMAIAAQLGGTQPLAALAGTSSEQVEAAIENATIDVWTGTDDRLLRRLQVSIEFSPAAEKVKSLVGAALDFTLEISNPNEPVSVEQPTNVQPFSP
jgi:hypothetical protein